MPEQLLAEEFKVSRTPIKRALSFLESMHVVEKRPNRGYFLLKAADELPATSFQNQDFDEDPLYFQIAEDRLNGYLSERISEAELMRKYGASRPRLVRLLTQMAKEGWLERLPGQGWEFQPTMTSKLAYEQSYEMRMLIEPAALRSPKYLIDRAAFAAVRSQQKSMLDGGIFSFSSTQTFQINIAFHETIVRCSGNIFFIDTLKRINRLRRLLEYRLHRDRTRLIKECQDHLKLLDLIESGDRERAAQMLEEHLGSVKSLKVDLAEKFDKF